MNFSSSGRSGRLSNALPTSTSSEGLLLVLSEARHEWDFEPWHQNTQVPPKSHRQLRGDERS